MNPPEDWLIFENTQEPIIEESVFMIVQNLRKGRMRITKMGEPSIFSGLLFCGDCGKKLHLHRTRARYSGIKARFVCSTYKIDSADCTAHYIRVEVLNEVILRNLREAIDYVSFYMDDFIREVSVSSDNTRNREFTKKRDTLKQSEKRVSELDLIIKRLYEDNVSGKLTDERFVKLSRDYEREQDGLKETIEILRRDLKEQKRKKDDLKSFVAITKKYTDLKELDTAVLREFIDKVYVYEKDKATNTRKIQMVYNFIGVFDFKTAMEQSQNVQSSAKAELRNAHPQ
jgi:hypothetical protein